MNVSKVLGTTLDYGLKKPLNWVANSHPMQSVCKNFQEGNFKYISGLAVVSMVLKDGLGCYMYVKQSLANKNIPEEKRKFVAALDLTNGGLMILAQLLMFKTISNKKVQGAIFDKLFGKLFQRPARKGTMELLSSASGKSRSFEKEFNLAFKNVHGNIKNTFGLLVTLVASTIVAKRIIVPFIATPLAEKAKRYMNKDDNKDKAANKDTFTQSANISK